MPKKIRIDMLLVERKLMESRSSAQRYVMAGQVRVNDQVVSKPSYMVDRQAKITIDHGPKYVSRGGAKLEAALDDFPIEVNGKTCADIGSSTGGFTDCLLQRGATRVYAIDVGKGILHWSLRKHPRVTVMEGTNARYIEALPEAVDLITIDASFISLKVLLPVVRTWNTSTPVKIICLIKPQFEAGRRAAAKGKGVIRDPEIHRAVLNDVIGFAGDEGFGLHGLIQSPVTGPKGNIEFLVYLQYPGEMPLDWEVVVDSLIPETEPENGY